MGEVVVFGAGGYSGLELVRWLAWHPTARVARASSDQMSGQRVSEAVAEFRDPLTFTSHVETLASTQPGQIAFLATPAQTAAELVPTLLERGLRVIDLSGAHRLPHATYPEWYGFEHPFPESLAEAVYGLPELVSAEAIAHARLVANPGCYVTAAALAAAPLLKSELDVPDAPLIVDGKSGTTGAGRSVKLPMLFSEVAEDVRPYRVGHHQHTPEMELILSRVSGVPVTVFFAAHIVPMRRGLLCSVYAPARPGVELEDVRKAFDAFYADTDLVRVRASAPPETKRTLGAAHAEVWASFDPRSGLIAAFCAEDNLVKGAAGQAIQNLNLMLGLPLGSGLLPPGRKG